MIQRDSLFPGNKFNKLKHVSTATDNEISSKRTDYTSTCTEKLVCIAANANLILASLVVQVHWSHILGVCVRKTAPGQKFSCLFQISPYQCKVESGYNIEHSNHILFFIQSSRHTPPTHTLCTHQTTDVEPVLCTTYQWYITEAGSVPPTVRFSHN